jgi:hypothetical protein
MWNLILGALLAAGAPDFEAQMLDGSAVAGQLVALDARQVTLQAADGSHAIEVGSLARLARQGAESPKKTRQIVWLELIDGSTLAAVDYTAAGSRAKLKLTSGADIELSTRTIRWVRFAPADAGEDKLSKQWSDIVETKASGDLLVVRKAGELDYLEGVQGDINADVCKFEVDKEVIPVKRLKVEGVVYFHAASAELPEPIGRLLAVDGSGVSLRGVALGADVLHVTTPAGVAFDVPLSETAALDFASGKIAYLSDLAVASATFVPFFGFKEQPASLAEFFRFRRDTAFDQSPLRLAGKTYRKGLALASRTTLVYKLPGKFRVFKAIAGIDDGAGELGNVSLQIKGDGKSLWRGDVAAHDAPRELEIDIAGVKRLEILVDYGADLDIGDRLDLAEARVTK